jgi:hypothetical protein
MRRKLTGLNINHAGKNYVEANNVMLDNDSIKTICETHKAVKKGFIEVDAVDASNAALNKSENQMETANICREVFGDLLIKTISK